MIDRRTALTCVTLITLMLVAAVWRVIALDDWTTFTVDNGRALPSLLLFFFPACCALVVGALYWDGVGAKADDAKLQPWRSWGRSLSIGYCGGLLLLQGVLIVGSLGLSCLSTSRRLAAGWAFCSRSCASSPSTGSPNFRGSNAKWHLAETWDQYMGHGTCEFSRGSWSCSWSR